jgi:peptidoglycan/LPS O-acetylase OafA/YrhL
LSVVIFHFGFYFKASFGIVFVGPTVAVKTFFIVSGFYMSLILNNKYTGKGAYLLFISNRFLRIYPAYWAVLIIILLASLFSYYMYGHWWMLNGFFIYFNSFHFSSFLYTVISNIIIFGQDILMFLGLNYLDGLFYFTDNFRKTNPQLHSFLLVPQAWTLSLELMFYLIAPFIVRKKTVTIIGLIMTSLILRIYICYIIGLNHDPWTYRFFFTEVIFFLMGSISYKIYFFVKEKRFSKWITISLSIFFLSATFFYQVIPGGVLKSYLYYFFAMISIPFIFLYFKNNKIDRLIGELSYPVYISHMLILHIVSPVIIKCNLIDYPVIAGCILSILFSVIIMRYLIDPIEKYRQLRVVNIVQ